MLTSLRLINFRRYDDATIDFSGDAQIVAIMGRNGAGKSTVLEAIQFALYGESRHGKKRRADKLAGLVRRGAEQEGMQVTLRFEVGGVSYRIERRFHKGKHTAALYAGEALKTQTPDGVTEEVSKIFGLQAAGFKVATVANQKELDGLANMLPSVRKDTIAKLLRIDEVESASSVARRRAKAAKDVASTLEASASPEKAAQAQLIAHETHSELRASLARSTSVLAEYDKQLGALLDVDVEYRNAQLVNERAKANRDAALADSQRLNAQLASAVIPTLPPAPARTKGEVTADLDNVNASIAAARAQEALTAQLSHTQVSLERDEHALQGLNADSLEATLLGIQESLAAHKSNVVVLSAEREVLQTRYAELTGQHATAAAALKDSERLLERTRNLGASCGSCGQDIADSYKSEQEAELAAAIEVGMNSVQELAERLVEVSTQGRVIDSELGTATEAQKNLEREALQLQNTQQRVGDLVNSIAVRKSDIARLEEQIVEVDLPAELASKGRLELERAEIDEYEHAQLTVAAAQERHRELLVSASDAASRLADSEDAVKRSEPSVELRTNWEQRQEILEARATEKEVQELLAVEESAAGARAEAADQAVAQVGVLVAEAAGRRRDAEVAGKAAQLLGDVAKRLATQIRPKLESRMCDLLQVMSQGRFSAVRISEDYDVTVCDHDGRFYPVSEYSGGETDLIALAMRLSLAQTVSQRHGAIGSGFLILDEVFGSQDDARRGAIMEALRGLRSAYGQILLISHVGGIEDQADMVLQVDRADEEEAAVVRVLAA